LDSSRLALVERFVSVQGEGGNAGRAALFIRFAGCNLDCHFADGSICDTPWRKAREKLTFDEVMQWCIEERHKLAPRQKVWSNVAHGQRHMVIITGGEPTMAPMFDKLVEGLKAQSFFVAAESNGTIWREGLRKLDYLVVSPKDRVRHVKMLADSPKVHPRILTLPPAEWRFVISNRDDEAPTYHPGRYHFVSPALLADGTGMEHQDPAYFPRFVPGAVERCSEIVQQDPRWRISLQTHKWMRVR
jgi:7-carboxy-7-deazaguanine synthase